MKAFLIIIGCGFAGLIAVAAIYKYIEVRIASRWPSAPGKVISSRVVRRRVGSVGGDEKDLELRNFAEVIYEFEVRGKKHRGNRVSIGEDLGNFQVEETLAKYPSGTHVTVFYNPLKPGKQSVLERDVPEGVFRFVFWLIGGMIALGVVLTVGIERLNDWLKATLPQGNSPLAIVLGFMGLFAFLLAIARARAARMAGSWPSVEGRIEEAGVEEFRTISNHGDREKWTRLKRPRIVYNYSVNGREYKSEKVSEGWKAAASFGALARREAAQICAGAGGGSVLQPCQPGAGAPRSPGQGRVAHICDRIGVSRRGGEGGRRVLSVSLSRSCLEAQGERLPA
ncbi:MAG: DUF3592 domain-containing protein [Xanthobacteraceae bacterium]|nr:DUF3592 domain-containing protein [Xanthobacteraceae bacterium]QYK44698.1 MAG: DUF3592 domain-containing protein [Xanthobacteraceae bacterium]